jgi:hypothetical protein
MKLIPALALVALALACRGTTEAVGPGVANTVGSAAVNSTIAMVAAGSRRQMGECYAACPPGTACDKRTGTCTTLPCGGKCLGWEYCDESGPMPRCLSAAPPDLSISKTTEAAVDPQ